MKCEFVCQGDYYPIMDELQPSSPLDELLYFWALGDLHYYAHPEWQATHTPRMKQMFQDLHRLWEKEGEPAFCISPGDIVELAEPESYQLAQQELTSHLKGVRFYPGLGNHELLTRFQESEAEMMDDFATFWRQPPRYFLVEGEVLCIMLDAVGYGKPELTAETLAFLETALSKHPGHIALLFVHCPLYGTVLDRNPALDLDYDSLEPFFYLENSTEVRDILAHYPNASLLFSGHTHAGWQSPGLVFTETLGGHPFTSVSLSSPWYTGKHRGIAWLDSYRFGTYRADDPDMLVSMAVHVSREQVILKLRDHRAGSWLAEWSVPIR